MKLLAGALSFVDATPALERLAALPERKWQELFAYADPAGLTLYLLAALERAGLASHLPESVTQALRERQEKNRLRLVRTMDEASEALETLRAAGLRAAMLKGFTLEPEFTADADLRKQYDLDLLLAPGDAQRAHRLFREKGYEQVLDDESVASSHLPALVRKQGWEWRGDYFDPEIPRTIEIHERLWNPEFERLEAEIDHDLVARIESREFRGRKFPVLHRHDQFASVVLHVAKHILHGNLRISHLYELAYFMERHANDATPWPAFGRLTAVAFAVAARVFGCRRPKTHGVLPAAEAWARRFSHTLWDREQASKCELLLHLLLIDNNRDRAAVMRRRLMPTRAPGPIDAVHLAPSELTPRRRALRFARQAGYFTKRAWFHARAIPGFTIASARWFLGK